MEQITVDLIPNGKMPMLHASQYDDGRQVRINLTENRQAYTLTGNEVLSLAVRKADNTLVTMDIANVYGGKSYVEFATTEQMTAVAGLSFGELTITNNGTKVGSLNFYIAVEPSPEAGGLRSESEINNLNRQIDDHIDEVLPEVLADDVPPIVERVIDETLAPVAKSGNYNDLENKPSIPAPQVNSDWNANSGVSQILNKPSLSTVATTGDYNDLLNKPSVAVIDDSEASASKVYSSEKVENELDKLYPIENVSGEIASFNTSLAKPLVSLKADIDYKSGGINTIKLANINGTNAEYFRGILTGAYRLIDLSNRNWGTASYSNVFTNEIVGAVCPPNYGTVAILICSKYATTNANNLTGSGHDKEIALTPNGYLWIKDTSYSNPADFKNSLIGVYAIVKYVTPITPTITKAEFEAACNAFGLSYNVEEIDISSYSIYGGAIEITPTTAKLISTKNADGTSKSTAESYDLASVEDFVAFIGSNNVFADSGNISECKYKVVSYDVVGAIDNIKNADKLYGKTLVCCGDSITYGEDMDSEGFAYSSDITVYQSDNYGDFTKVTSQFRKTWGYQIAERNNMTFYNAGVSGSTMQGIEARKGFSLANGRYTKLPNNIDYLLIWFGWNDLAYGTLGTISDNTNESYYGGYNVVLPYLINKYPYTKIALIVPFGSDENHRNAVRELGNKWGLAVWDNYKGGTPLYFGKEASVGVEASIVTSNQAKFQANGAHPNFKGHRQLADMIEQFLRGI